VLIDAVIARIHAVSPGITPIRSRYEPAVGALLLAFDAAGLAMTPERMDRLERSLPPASLFLT
jgi:hypothetical protein